MIDDEQINIYKKAIGLFSIIDYRIPTGYSCAKGRLESVSETSIVIKHLYDERIWIINIEDITNSKFSPVREVNQNE